MAKKIFQFDSYKEFVKNTIRSYPNQGRGQFSKMARELNMHTAVVSQIFNGTKELTFEQAILVCHYFGLSRVESDYFLKLVQFARAGSETLREFLSQELKRLRENSGELINILPPEKVLDSKQKAIFYSSWSYSAVRLLTSISEFNTVEKISRYLGLPVTTVNSRIEFLEESGLVERDVDGNLKLGPGTTHLESYSPYIQQHHRNWRIKAVEKHESLGVEELCYSCPLTISKKGMKRVRERLVEAIQDTLDQVRSEEPDELMCLNIDWFKVQ